MYIYICNTQAIYLDNSLYPLAHRTAAVSTPALLLSLSGHLSPSGRLWCARCFLLFPLFPCNKTRRCSPLRVDVFQFSCFSSKMIRARIRPNQFPNVKDRQLTQLSISSLTQQSNVACVLCSEKFFSLLIHVVHCGDTLKLKDTRISIFIPQSPKTQRC